MLPSRLMTKLVAALAIALAFSPQLHATGALVCKPSALWFGAVPVGATKSAPILLMNAGTTTMTVWGLTNQATGFTASLPLPLRLAPGQSVPVQIFFHPRSAAYSEGRFIFTNNGRNPSVPFRVHGTGASGLAANPAREIFDSVKIGSQQQQRLTLVNASAADVTLSSVAVSGAGFSQSGIQPPLTLAAGQSATFQVLFAPTLAGPASGSLVVTSNAHNQTLRVPLSGSTTALGLLQVTPATLSFGSVALGSTKTLTTTLGASGAPVVVTAATFNSPEFVLAGLNFPAIIPAGQSLPINIRFTPQAAGAASARVAFAGDAVNAPLVATLAGTGLGPVAHEVSLAWDPSTSSAVGYNVYRGTNSGGPYARLNSVPDPATAFIDTNVAGGATYYYVATALDSAGVESNYSKEVRVAIPAP